MDVTLTSADGITLRGRLTSPDPAAGGEVLGAAVLCHPHPAFGGTMDVWLLPMVADALSRAGWACLRFDFRGAGLSDGVQTGGELEHLDAMAAVEDLRARYPGRQVIGIGWSFGAMITLRLGRSIDAWIGIGAPTRRDAVPLEGPLLPDELPSPRTVIVGEHDQFFPPRSQDILSPDQLIVITDADHFLFDRDPEVAAHVVAALPAVAHRPAQAGS